MHNDRRQRKMERHKRRRLERVKSKIRKVSKIVKIEAQKPPTPVHAARQTRKTEIARNFELDKWNVVKQENSKDLSEVVHTADPPLVQPGFNKNAWGINHG